MCRKAPPRLSEGSSYKPFEDVTRNMFQALFSKGFTMEQLRAEFGEETDKLRPLLINCIQNPTLLQFNPLNENVFKYQIKEMSLGQLGTKAQEFRVKHLMTPKDYKEYLIKINPRMEHFLEAWKGKDFKTIRPTSVGFAVAVLNYNRITGENIPVESFI